MPTGTDPRPRTDGEFALDVTVGRSETVVAVTGDLDAFTATRPLVAVDVGLLDVLVDAERRVAARGGKLWVSTKAGCWRPAFR